MIRTFCALLCAAGVALPISASAHLLHEHNGTMKIVGNTANFVISVPVSALEDVDRNGDGLLSVDELESGKERIIAQFERGFNVSRGDTVGTSALILVVSPETHNPEAPTRYVVVMQRVFFDEKPEGITVSFNLFGPAPTDQRVLFRASDGENSETATLTPEHKQHTFF